MKIAKILATFVLLAGTLAGHALAQQAKDPAQANATRSGIFGLLPKDSITRHTLKTSAGDFSYTATVGTFTLFGQDGKATAKIVYTAYTADKTDAARPLTFAFNGGPGAASAYLHLGLTGPKILDFGPDHDGATPALSDNPDSWISFTDLVLIDPVGTGWSRAANDTIASGFYGVRADAESLAKVIALYVQHNNRTASPKFLLGESYGGFRAAKVAAALKDSQGLLVSGIVMVSPLIDGRLTFGTTDNPLAAALLIPSLAAAEMERKKTFSPEAIAKAEKYAMSDYLVGLAGASPSGKEADQFYTHIAGLTGIPEKSVEKTRGFVGDVYTKALGETQQGKVASPYDASYLAPDAYPESVNDHNDDPILDGFTRAYGPAFVSYARNDLGFACDMTYNLLSEDVNHQWQWQDRRGGGTRADASVSDDLRDLLSTIPSFRLMILGGYSDAVTPFAASRYVLDHLPPALIKGRAGLFLYRGGHMFYARQDSRRAASRDVRQFFDGNLQLE